MTARVPAHEPFRDVELVYQVGDATGRIGAPAVALTAIYPTPCQVKVSPTQVELPAVGGSATIQASARDFGCDWTSSSDKRFLKIAARPSGVQTFAVTVTAPENVGSAPLATVEIGGQELTVQQSGTVRRVVTVSRSSPASQAATRRSTSSRPHNFEASVAFSARNSIPSTFVSQSAVNRTTFARCLFWRKRRKQAKPSMSGR